MKGAAVPRAQLLKVVFQNLFALAAVLDGAKVLQVQALGELEVVAPGVQVEKPQCVPKLADDARGAVFARELRQRGEDARKVDFVRRRPIPIVVTLLAVVLSQNLDVAHAKQFALRAVFHLAVHMFHLADRGSTVGNAV